MESYVDKALDEVVKCITNSKEYKKCIELKKKMQEDEEIKLLVSEVKKLQKQFIKTNDLDIKKELDNINNRLDEIPIYVVYKQNLEIVNEKIEFIKDELNDYFYKLFNK